MVDQACQLGEFIGPAGYFLAPLVMVVCAVLPIPAEFPALLNGAISGPVCGSLVTWGGSLVGAQISFEASRWCGRPLVERFVPRRQTWNCGWTRGKSVAVSLLLVRLIPLVPFTVVNWSVGLTLLRRRTFI
jgi:uncharacterized membrane protein YdjX (TVP38/TMEM64 family)